ncbi:MAG: metal ABC transporter substrate-binding protein [Thermotogota bacterium]
MKRIVTALIIVTALSLVTGAVPTVVATHAVYGEFARVVGGDLVNVITIIPSGFCPDHYDLAPSDVRAVVGASIIFYSGFESWIGTLATATASTAKVIQLPGTWNTPDAAIAKVQAVETALEDLLPDQREKLASNAAAYIAQLEALASDLHAQASAHAAGSVPVVCMAWQESFVTWLGFHVVATYGKPETLSLSDLVSLTATGREAGAQMVIDNLQSGLDFGAKLAHEVAAVHVVLSNFPGAMPNTATVPELLAANASALFAALQLPVGGTP